MNYIEKLDKLGYVVTEGYNTIFVFGKNTRSKKTIYLPFKDVYGRNIILTDEEIY